MLDYALITLCLFLALCALYQKAQAAGCRHRAKNWERAAERSAERMEKWRDAYQQSQLTVEFKGSGEWPEILERK